MSLTFSIVALLDTCLTASRLYSSAKNISSDFESLTLELLWQQSRFKWWAKTWQIPVDGDAIGTAATTAVAVLEREV